MLKVILILLAIVCMPQLIVLFGIYAAVYIFWKKVFDIGKAIYNGDDLGGNASSSEKDGTEFHSTGAPYL